MTTFRAISAEEMMSKHMDDYFWFAVDFSGDEPMVVANPFVDDMEELTYIFQEKEDAEKWAYLISKTPAHQRNKIGVQSATFRSLLKDVEEELGRFKLAAISHAEAQKLFENYPEFLQFYESEKERKGSSQAEEE